MKKLLIILFSLFFLSSPSVFADDISDFQIEGISIGDSLLDYMTEKEILKEIEINKNDYYYLNEPNKYAEVYSNNQLENNFTTYDYLSFYVKNNVTNNYITNKNEKFTILSIRGLIRYVEDFENCIQKSNEIAEVLSRMFPSAEKYEWEGAHSIDPSGRSKTNTIAFFIDPNLIDLQCSDYEENFRKERNYTEGFSINISTKAISDWGSNY